MNSTERASGVLQMIWDGNGVPHLVQRNILAAAIEEAIVQLIPDEREACAKLSESFINDTVSPEQAMYDDYAFQEMCHSAAAKDIARAIRQRGQS